MNTIDIIKTTKQFKNQINKNYMKKNLNPPFRGNTPQGSLGQTLLPQPIQVHVNGKHWNK